MSRPDDGAAAYAQKVHESTWRFAQELLAENERLRATVALLESDKRLLEEELRSTRALLEQHEQARARLQERLGKIEADSGRLAAQLEQLEQQNWIQLNLYVASYRLNGTLDRDELVRTIQEIIANLIGSEEGAIFELDRDRGLLRLVASFGVDASGLDRIPLGEGIIGRAALTGETYVAPSAAVGRPQADGLAPTAVIPLRLAETVTGAIAIFRLLPQKAGLEAVDRELFAVLGTHAAMALYCTRLHARAVAAGDGL